MTLKYDQFDFGEAVRRLNENKTVSRIGWYEKFPFNEFLVLVPENKVGNQFTCGAYIGIVSGKQHDLKSKHWYPNQEDIVASDWVEFNFYEKEKNQ